MAEKKLLTISETAERLSLGITKTYELIRMGRLNSVRIGRAVRIPTAELESFVAKLQADQSDESHEVNTDRAHGGRRADR